jgi:IS30 family transposase
MTYQHLSQTERYQIYILMKDGKTKKEIARLIHRHPSTISRELARNAGDRGYRPKQAGLLAQERALGSRNAPQISSSDWNQVLVYLNQKWSPEQIAQKVGISHETIYRHIYADKAAGGQLYQQLRLPKETQKTVCWRERSSRANHR